MSVLAEFVGGPLDGEIRAMQDAPPTWYVPRAPQVSAFVIVSPQLLKVMQPLAYRRAERRSTPAGGLIYRYRLEGS